MQTQSMTNEELMARIAELESLVEREKQEKSLTFKVSEKGAVSVYGLQRFPVTLYGNQWARIIEQAPALQSFMEKNASLLKTK